MCKNEAAVENNVFKGKIEFNLTEFLIEVYKFEMQNGEKFNEHSTYHDLIDLDGIYDYLSDTDFCENDKDLARTTIEEKIAENNLDRTKYDIEELVSLALETQFINTYTDEYYSEWRSLVEGSIKEDFIHLQELLYDEAEELGGCPENKSYQVVDVDWENNKLIVEGDIDLLLLHNIACINGYGMFEYESFDEMLRVNSCEKTLDGVIDCINSHIHWFKYVEPIYGSVYDIFLKPDIDEIDRYGTMGIFFKVEDYIYNDLLEIKPSKTYKIIRGYSKVTEESADEGDFSDYGFVDSDLRKWSCKDEKVNREDFIITYDQEGLESLLKEHDYCIIGIDSICTDEEIIEDYSTGERISYCLTFLDISNEDFKEICEKYLKK